MRQEIGLGALENRRKPHCSGIYVCIEQKSSLYCWISAKLATENAVDPMNVEPNLALDLEISDLINSKKGNAYGLGEYVHDRKLTEWQPSRSCCGYRQLYQ